MFRTGLFLLLTTSFGVLLQSLDFVEPTDQALTWICSFSSLGAVACFVGTYFRLELAHNHSDPHK